MSLGWASTVGSLSSLTGHFQQSDFMTRQASNGVAQGRAHLLQQQSSSAMLLPSHGTETRIPEVGKVPFSGRRSSRQISASPRVIEREETEEGDRPPLLSENPVARALSRGQSMMMIRRPTMPNLPSRRSLLDSMEKVVRKDVGEQETTVAPKLEREASSIGGSVEATQGKQRRRRRVKKMVLRRVRRMDSVPAGMQLSSNRAVERLVVRGVADAAVLAAAATSGGEPSTSGTDSKIDGSDFMRKGHWNALRAMARTGNLLAEEDKGGEGSEDGGTSVECSRGSAVAPTPSGQQQVEEETAWDQAASSWGRAMSLVISSESPQLQALRASHGSISPRPLTGESSSPEGSTIPITFQEVPVEQSAAASDGSGPKDPAESTGREDSSDDVFEDDPSESDSDTPKVGVSAEDSVSLATGSALLPAVLEHQPLQPRRHVLPPISSPALLRTPSSASTVNLGHRKKPDSQSATSMGWQSFPFFLNMQIAFLWRVSLLPCSIYFSLLEQGFVPPCFIVISLFFVFWFLGKLLLFFSRCVLCSLLFICCSAMSHDLEEWNSHLVADSRLPIWDADELGDGVEWTPASSPKIINVSSADVSIRQSMGFLNRDDSTRHFLSSNALPELSLPDFGVSSRSSFSISVDRDNLFGSVADPEDFDDDASAALSVDSKHSVEPLNSISRSLSTTTTPRSGSVSPMMGRFTGLNGVPSFLPTA